MIGIEHNQGLYILYQNLKTMKKNLGSLNYETYNSYIEMIEKGAKSYTLQNHPEMPINGIAELNRRFSDIKKYISPPELDLKGLIAAAVSNLTSIQQIYAQKIINATLSDRDLNSILRDLDKLEAEIREKVTPAERHILMAAISVAKHSSQYWDENSQKWANEFGSPEIWPIATGSNHREGPITWKIVAGTDVGAALFYGGTSAWLTMFPGIGWASWGIYTTAFTMATSGTMALGKIIVDRMLEADPEKEPDEESDEEPHQ